MSSMRSHCDSRWTAIPRFLNCFRSSLAASSSSCGIRVGSISTIVTSLPKRLRIDANSQPMIPPPRTTMRLGTSVCASRPVESTQRAESMPSIGGRSAYEPVATIALLKVTSSPPSTAIVFASLKRPVPCTHSTPFALNRRGDAARELVDDLVLPGVRGAEVELRLTDRDADLGEGLLCFLEREGRLDPGLRRNAPDAEARAPEAVLLLDADGLRPELRGPDRGAVAAGAAAEDGDVTFHGLALSVRFAFQPRSYPRPRSRRRLPSELFGRPEALDRTAGDREEKDGRAAPVPPSPLTRG